MKRPVIKDWDFIEHDPIDLWMPEDPSDVEFWCNIAVGFESEEGADIFQVHIATKHCLESTVKRF